MSDRYVSLIEEGFDLTIRAGVPTDSSARGRTDNSEVAFELARRGLGIALLTDRLVIQGLAWAKLVRLLATYEVPPAPVYAVTPPGRHLLSPVRALVEFLAASPSLRTATP